jgi:GTP pyrophosphokinase
MREEYEKSHQKNVTDEEILEELSEPNRPKKISVSSKNGIVVHGMHDVSVRFSHCCNPVPGDEIVGFITRGRGVSVHRTDCINLLAMSDADRQRIIEAEWDKMEQDQNGERFETEITIYAYTQPEMLVNLTKVFTERGINIVALNARNGKQGKSTYVVSLETSGTEELNSLITKLRSMEGVIDIERTTG